ncbi:uncharacterized protein STEHIDRAFT_146370 [Stereum hirsutum FP-91666 SS1]|uniref:uncharacterized protein n=1 Tax=Stereum hirsutum (strain FP-91666) TaxID=721885 RepID=UPI000440D2BF|nr:uncharacterized protein STEHIDRAFT_146370 [Stereum hirsutum FP-91666 SS1]EIM88343.1 hypothetical protein STEHIDRAFT_146370 [Stereum hirsutum FP-91666 SS1]
MELSTLGSWLLNPFLGRIPASDTADTGVVTHGPVYRLPAELLAIILHFSRSIDPPTTRNGRCDGGEDPLYLGWIRLTHVCQYWRHVALSDSALWDDIRIDFLGEFWAREMISRSRSCPLTITHEYEKHEAVATDIFENHLDRVQFIHLVDVGAALILSMARPAPVLQSLEIDVTAPEDNNLPYIVHLPATFLAGCAPRLKTLILENVTPPWNSPILSHLTTLSLRYSKPNSQTTRPFELRELLQALQRMPSLQTLGLQNCPTPFLGPTPTSGTIKLPNLTVLNVGKVSTSSFVRFGSLLVLPNLRRLTIQSFVPVLSTAAWDGFFNTLKSLFPDSSFVDASPRAQFHRLVIHAHLCRQGDNIFHYRVNATSLATSSCYRTCLKFIVHSAASPTEFCKALLASLPFQDLSILILADESSAKTTRLPSTFPDWSWTEEDCRSFFTSLPSLKMVVCGHRDLTSFWDSLFPSSPRTAEEFDMAMSVITQALAQESQVTKRIADLLSKSPYRRLAHLPRFMDVVLAEASSSGPASGSHSLSDDSHYLPDISCDAMVVLPRTRERKKVADEVVWKTRSTVTVGSGETQEEISKEAVTTFRLF